MREWTHTLPNGLPLWELESQRTFESLKGNFRGQNSLDWRVHYIIEKILERRCLKWVRTSHWITWNTSYGRKKGWESNYQFDFQSLKIRIRSDLLMCKWCVTYRWKVLDEGYNFTLGFTSIKSLYQKLWASKVAGVPISRISNQHGSLKTKWHLDAGLVDRHKNYYKGGRWWFPPSSGHGEFCEFVVAGDSSMHQKWCRYAPSNLLFSLCRTMWINNPLTIHPSLHPEPQACPSTPNCCELMNVLNFFKKKNHFWTYIWIFQRVWG